MTIPTKNELFLTQIGDLQRRTGDTYKSEDIVYSLLQAISSTQQDLYEYTDLKFALNFWLSRLTFDQLLEVGSILLKPLLQGSQSSGFVVIFGTAGIQIAAQSILVNGANQYQTLNSAVIGNNSFSILSVSRVGTLATAITSQPHNLGSGCLVTISGFTETNFNKTTTINVISDIAFTYTVNDSGSTTGSNGTLSYTACIVQIQALEIGTEKDLQNGTLMSFEPTISNITNVIVNFYGITGGSDVESQQEYYTRLSDNIINKLPKSSQSKIIATISEQFPFITKGKVISKYTNTIGVASIVKDLTLNNNYQRKITCKTAHGLTNLTFFKSIAGANSAILNISDQLTSNRGISKIYDSYSFVINVENTTAEDNTSSNMVINFSGFNSAIILYKSESEIKTLNANEIQAVKDYLINDVVNFENTQDSFYIFSATPLNQTLNITLLPKITTLQNTVQNNVYDYVLKQAEIGGNIKKNAIDRIIENSADDNSNIVTDFSTNMIGDWTCLETQIISLPKSNITFS